MIISRLVFLLFVGSLVLAVETQGKDLRHRSLIASLAQVREAMAVDPGSVAAWGQATTGYALLCLQNAPSEWAVCGPWLDYAERAERILDAARGHAPATIDEALPGLWVAAVRHQGRGVVQTLERLAPSSTRAEIRALRAIAQWRPQAIVEPSTDSRALAQTWRTLAPVEQFAFLSACVVADARDPLRLLPKSSRLDPWAAAIIAYNRTEKADFTGAARAIYADTAWMLQSKDLDEAAAVALLTPLATALDLTPAQDRQTLLPAILAALEKAPIDRPELYVASYLACIACFDKARGWTGTTPSGLVGLGDIARWNRDRHYWLMTYHWQLLKEAEVAPFLRVVTAGLGEILPVVRARLRYSFDHSGGPELAAAVAAELDAPPALAWPPGILVEATKRAGEVAGGDVTGVLAPLARLTDGEPHDLLAMIKLCDGFHQLDLIAPRMRQALEDDAWNGDLLLLGHLLENPIPRFGPPLASVSATWRDATVDFSEVRRDRGMVEQYAAMRWTGTLDCPTAGIYRIGTVSDDGSFLSVGQAFLNNGAYNGMKVVSTEVQGPARELPLDLAYFNLTGGAACRLLWQPPGTSDFVPIPSSALRSGGEAGLTGTLMNFEDYPHLAIVLTGKDQAATLAERVPWSAVLARKAADQALARRDWGDVARWSQAAERAGQVGVRDREATALLMQEPPALAKAAAAVAKGGSWIDREEMDRLVLQLALHHPAAIDKGFPLDQNWPASIEFLRAQCHLVRGDLTMIPRGFSSAYRSLQDPESFSRGYNVASNRLREALLLYVLVTRAQEPQRSLAPLTGWVGDEQPLYANLAEFLVGTRALGDLSENVDPSRFGDLAFFTAIYYRSIGDHVRAKVDLARAQSLLEHHPILHGAVTGLLAWYAKQTPEDLAREPKAPPLNSPSSGSNGF